MIAIDITLGAAHGRSIGPRQCMVGCPEGPLCRDFSADHEQLEAFATMIFWLRSLALDCGRADSGWRRRSFAPRCRGETGSRQPTDAAAGGEFRDFNTSSTNAGTSVSLLPWAASSSPSYPRGADLHTIIGSSTGTRRLHFVPFACEKTAFLSSGCWGNVIAPAS